MSNKEGFKKELAAVLKIAPEELTAAAVLEDFANWDSLAIASTLALVDQHFRRAVAPGPLRRCRTFGDILALAGEEAA